MVKLFGTSGIRGLVSKKITPEFSVKLGLSAAKYYGPGSRVIVGFDHRLQARVVAKAFIAGLLAGGVNVLNAEVAPTPAVLYAVRDLKADGAVIITGSHTIPEIIGLLFFKENTAEFSRCEEEGLEKIFFDGRYERMPWNRLGREENIDVSEIYCENVLKRVNISKVSGRKVVVDVGNSCAGRFLRNIFYNADVEVITVNDYPDPFFRGRDPFPRTDNLQLLGRITNASGADIGVGIDGDGDRALFCDEKGSVYWGDVSGAIFAMQSLERGIKKIVVTINTSHIVYSVVNDHGGEVVFSRVGPPAIADTMIRNNAGYGIEESGKYLWADAIYYGDAALATLRMLEFLEEKGESLSSLIARLPKFRMKKVAIKCPDELKKLVLELSAQKVKELFWDEVQEVVTIDGVKIVLKDGSWVLLRPSGTEPVFRVFSESRLEEKANELLKIGEKAVLEAISKVEKK